MNSTTETSQQFTPMLWVPTLIAGIFSLLLISYIDRLEREQYTKEAQTQTLKYLSSLNSSIENQINQQIFLFTGLVGQISLNPQITDDEIQKAAALLVDSQTLIRSFGLSRGYTIATVYPLEGNEAAIGKSYLKLPNQLSSIQAAIQSRNTIVSGPFNLVQGGRALIARMPIFTETPFNGEPPKSFWGVISVLIDIEQLFANINQETSDLPIEVAIRKSTPNPEKSQVIYGNHQLFDDPLSSTLIVNFPGDSWELAGKGTSALTDRIEQRSQFVLILGIISAILFTLMIFFFTRQYLQQQKIIDVQKISREQIWHAATHDRLTGMANRHLFNEEIKRLVALAESKQQQLAILFLDLDRFKDINDSFGHNTGDLFLKEFAVRLKKVVSKNELLARLGGDEFAIVVLNLTPNNVADLAHRVTQSLNKSIVVDQHSLNAGVSIGISVYPTDGNDPETLMNHADVAMYEAKKNPLSSYSFFEEAMNTAAAERKKLVDNIRNALVNKEFYLVYQPIINIQTGLFVGMETLVRWEHPELGNISPAEFIPAAEGSGLIIPLGEWIFETAIYEMESLLSTNRSAILSINLSPIELYRSDPIERITQILRKTGISPEQLDVEITESTILEDVDIATAMIHQMRDLGISVSIDDFGTGYSSLSHLQQLPVSRIKIDLSFVRKIGIDTNSEAIIKAIFYLSSLMGVRVTAEGVETEQQLFFLKELGCEEVQGYYFSKPIKGDALKTFFEARSGVQDSKLVS